MAVGQILAQAVAQELVCMLELERRHRSEKADEEREDIVTKLVVFLAFLLELFPERRGLSGADGTVKMLECVGMESRHLLLL